jgi:hypothetical protein
MAHTKRMAALDKAAIRSPATAAAAAGGRRGYQVSLTEVEETKSFMSLMPVFLTVIIWQVRAPIACASACPVGASGFCAGVGVVEAGVPVICKQHLLGPCRLQ